MAGNKRSILVPLLAVAVAVLGYANWRFATMDVDIQPLAEPAGSAAKAAPVKDLALSQPVRTVADYPQTATRPIFFPDRKQPEKPKPKPVAVIEPKEPVTAPAPPAPPPEPLVLVGIMGEGSGRRALVRTAADQQGTWISVGDEFRGWQLREISADNAIVEARGYRNELRLYAYGGQRSVKR